LELTYAQVGDTANAELPAGYHHLRRRTSIGDGELVWQRAKAGLRRWRGHEFAGMTITPRYAPLEVGSTLIATRRLGLLVVIAPCRIVSTTDRADRFGFAYGTLPGHLAVGEERFLIERAIDGTVSFEITAFSRPAATITRLGGPLGRALQARITGNYLEGLRRFASA
jgi:uncharacterized protein (UPF0548 family)